MPPPAADDPIQQFLAADLTHRVKALTDTSQRSRLLPWLGEEAVAAYDRLAPLVAGHLADRPKNLVFVPGVMGSLLSSAGLGGVWWLDLRSRKHLNDLRLSPDGTTDAVAAHDVVPFEVDMTYEGFLAAVLAQRDLAHQSFAYDWRKPLLASTQRLKELVLRLPPTAPERGPPGRPQHGRAANPRGAHALTRSCGTASGGSSSSPPRTTGHRPSVATSRTTSGDSSCWRCSAAPGPHDVPFPLGGVEPSPGPTGVYPGTRPGDPYVTGVGVTTPIRARTSTSTTPRPGGSASARGGGRPLATGLGRRAGFHQGSTLALDARPGATRPHRRHRRGRATRRCSGSPTSPAFGFLWQTMDRVTERNPETRTATATAACRWPPRCSSTPARPGTSAASTGGFQGSEPSTRTPSAGSKDKT